MQGTVYLRGKTWFYMVDIGKDADGKRKQKSHRLVGAKSEREAKKMAMAIAHSLNTGDYIEPTKMTVGLLLDRWLKDVVPMKATARTIDRYESAIRMYLKPTFGGLAVAKLQPMAIQGFYADLMRQGKLKPGSIRKIAAIFKTALEQGVKWQVFVRNPASAVEMPKVERRPMKVLTDEETQLLIAGAKGNQLYMPILLAVTTGMRRGEILGLRWSAVIGSKVIVQETLEQAKHKVLRLKEPKTDHSKRVISLPQFVVLELDEHRQTQAATKKAMGSLYQDNDLVCPRWNGRPFRPTKLSENFGEILKKLGLPQVRFHDLRHGHATMLGKAGAPMKVIQERLGHATIAMTGDIYQHVFPDMQEHAANQVESILAPKRPVH